MKKLILLSERVERNAKVVEAIRTKSFTEVGVVDTSSALSSTGEMESTASEEQLMLTIEALRERAEFVSTVLEDIVRSTGDPRWVA